MNSYGICVTSSGRKVSLVSLRMTRTFRGLLAGSPESLTVSWRRNNHEWFVEHLRHGFKYVQAAIVIDEGWSAFPSFHWMALFEGAAVQAENSEWESRSCVCWFTPGIPSSFNEMVAGVVGKLVWEEVAEDFDASP